MTQTLRWGYLPLADSIATLLCCQAMETQGQPCQLIKFANNHLLLEAWKQGEIDGGVSSAVFLPELAADNRRGKILGAASREGVTIFASKPGKFKKLSKLEGAVISIPAKLTVHGALLYKELQKQGLEWGQEVMIKYLPPVEGFKALAEGTVDLVPALEPLASRIEAEGKFLAAAHSRELWPRHLSFITIISTEKLSQEPTLEISWKTSYKEALKQLSCDYQRVAAEMTPLLGCDPQSLQRVLRPDKPKILYDELVISEKEKKEWQTLVAVMKGLI